MKCYNESRAVFLFHSLPLCLYVCVHLPVSTCIHQCLRFYNKLHCHSFIHITGVIFPFTYAFRFSLIRCFFFFKKAWKQKSGKSKENENHIKFHLINFIGHIGSVIQGWIACIQNSRTQIVRTTFKCETVSLRNMC